MIPRALILLLSSFCLLPSAFSQSEADKKLHAAVDQTIGAAESSRSNVEFMKKVRPLVDKFMSLPAMTRRAIGPGWRQFTPAQQKQAIALFTELIIRRYAGRFTIGEHPEVVYKSATTPAPGRAEVVTSLLYKGSRYEVIYRLEQAEGWRITDVVVEGVSFIANYRSQFNAPYQKGGPAGVIAALEGAVNNPK
jgi:phospholipid transport system substrate-binding protein